MGIMTLIVTDPRDQARLIAERRASGADRFDEVWDGDYVMSPIADNEHQDLQGLLTSAFLQAQGTDRRTRVHPGANISDREEGWEHNYRCPDVAVFLANTSARDCGSHWFGGPDFAVEILSPGDRTPKKLPFYASVSVRELLVIARDPWSLELFRLGEGEMASVGKVDSSARNPLSSEVLPLSFRLIAGSPRPIIEVRHRDTGQIWSA
jgi:Uma2 family endonuclease